MRGSHESEGNFELNFAILDHSEIYKKRGEQLCC